MTTTPSKEAREAAAHFCRFAPLYRDSRDLAQAFHRFQLEERERCAKIAENCAIFMPFAPGLADGASCASAQIATAIRQQGDAGE